MARTASTTAKKTTARKSTATRATTTRAKASKPATRSTLSKATRQAQEPKAAKKPAPIKAFKDAPTKTEVMNIISEQTALTRKQVISVFESLSEIIGACIKKNAAGEFTVPSLMKIKIVRKPATKARKGINPFTGEETMFQAKPARNVVKIKALKKLKEMAE